MNDYKIKNILESLKEEVENGKVSLREAAVELHKAGWTNFIDIDATRNLLKFSFRDLDVYLPKLIRAGNRVAVCEPNQTGSGKRV